jgi:hypothetical protein
MVVLGGLGLLVGIVLEDMWWLVGDRLQGLDSLWTVIGKRAPLVFPCRSKIKTGEDGNRLGVRMGIVNRTRKTYHHAVAQWLKSGGDVRHHVRVRDPSK